MKYWIGVASRDHVQQGVVGGFCQFCHGKEYPLRRMGQGDWIIYYSPKEEINGKKSCQRFTAIGQVVDQHVFSMSENQEFKPFRRRINFFKAKAVEIRLLIECLDFIGDKSRWGYVFRYGHLQISQLDFEKIAKKMLGSDFESYEFHDEVIGVEPRQIQLF